MYFAGPRQTVRPELYKWPVPKISYQQPQGPAGNSKQAAFHEALTNQPPAICSQGCANGELAFSRHGSRQQQTCNVYASNQQNHAYRAQQQPERRSNIPDQFLLKRVGSDVDAIVGIRILLRELITDQRQFGPCAGKTCA